MLSALFMVGGNLSRTSCCWRAIHAYELEPPMRSKTAILVCGARSPPFRAGVRRFRGALRSSCTGPRIAVFSAHPIAFQGCFRLASPAVRVPIGRWAEGYLENTSQTFRMHVLTRGPPTSCWA